MRRLILFLTAFCLAAAASAQTFTDIPYSPSEDAYARERCKLDLYIPAGAQDCPVVVWFHGGGLTGHPDVSIYELQGYNHVNMADPAVQILRDNIARILERKSE